MTAGWTEVIVSGCLFLGDPVAAEIMNRCTKVGDPFAFMARRSA